MIGSDAAAAGGGPARVQAPCSDGEVAFGAGQVFLGSAWLGAEALITGSLWWAVGRLLPCV